MTMNYCNQVKCQLSKGALLDKKKKTILFVAGKVGMFPLNDLSLLYHH